MLRCVLAERNQLVTTFSESHKHRQSHRTQDNPRRRHRTDDDGPCDGPQHKTAGDAHDIQNRLPLQRVRVGDILNQIDRHQRTECHAEKKAAPDCHRGKPGHCCHCGSGAEGSRGQRPQSLLRMLTVFLNVVQVVQQVDRAGSKTEQQKPLQSQQHACRVEQGLREDKASKQQQILDPLMRTHRFQKRADAESTDWLALHIRLRVNAHLNSPVKCPTQGRLPGVTTRERSSSGNLGHRTGRAL